MILSDLASRRRQRQAAIPALAHITPSPWRQGWRQLRRNRLAMVLPAPAGGDGGVVRAGARLVAVE